LSALVIASCTAFTRIAPSQRATLQNSKEDTLFNTKRMLLPEASSSILAAGDVLHGNPIIALPAAALSDVSNSFLTAVEVFDGSTIVDPVVVSDVFWSSLRAKFLALIVGQVLSAIVFAAFSSFFATQISQVGSFVTEKLFPEDLTKKNSAQATPNIPSHQISIDANYGKLLVCLAIDFFGVASEAIPVLGELADVVYAPVAATLLRSIYGGSNVLFGLEFAEEILPLTDVIPLATIAWVVETYFANSDLAKILSVGNYNQSRISAPDAIDTNVAVDSSASQLPGDADRRQ